MDEPSAPSLDAASAPERPPISLLMRELLNNAEDFARAEVNLVRARLGEGWSYALPAFYMFAAGAALAIGALIALPVGVMFILADYVGLMVSVVLVMAFAALAGWVLFKLGVRRIKSALKPLEKRP